MTGQLKTYTDLIKEQNPNVIKNDTKVFMVESDVKIKVDGKKIGYCSIIKFNNK